MAYSKSILFILILSTSQFLCADGEFESLEKSSPFIPYDFKGSPPTKGGPGVGVLQFRGVLELNGVTEFSIFDSKAQTSAWVSLNDRAAPYMVQAYNPVEKLITLQVAGRTEQIKLNTPDDKPLTIANESATSSSGPKKFIGPENKKPVPQKGLTNKPTKEETSKRVYEAFQRYIENKKKREQESQK